MFKKFNFWLYFIIVARVASAILIFFNHFWGLIIYFIFDWVDSQILLYGAKISRSKYEVRDKYLDWVGHTFMLVSSIGSPYIGLLSVLFVFRLIGQIVFSFTKNEKVFLFFPNFFEHMFFWFVALGAPDLQKYLGWFIVVIVLSPVREILLHLFWPYFIKKKGFKNGILENIFSSNDSKNKVN